MRLAVRQVNVNRKTTTIEVAVRQAVAAISSLEGPDVACGIVPVIRIYVVEADLGIARVVLLIAEHLVPLRPVHSPPVALRAGIRLQESGRATEHLPLFQGF